MMVRSHLSGGLKAKLKAILARCSTRTKRKSDAVRLFPAALDAAVYLRVYIPGRQEPKVKEAAEHVTFTGSA